MRYNADNSTSQGIPRNAYDKTAGIGGVVKNTGVFVGKVIETVDDRYEGFLHVEIYGQGYIGDTDSKADRANYVRVRRGSPYGGSYQFANATNSYGMSSHPPAPGTSVLVAFPANSDTGIVVCVLPDITRNASVPTDPTAVSYTHLTLPTKA